MNQAVKIESQENTQSAFKRVLSECAKFQQSNQWASVWQVVNTFVPYFVLLVLMYQSLDYSYWLTLCFGLLAGAFTVRIFMIQHDCGHGSFFNSRAANDSVGSFCSFFTVIPYYYWRRQHALHHAANGNLDHRGHGDVDVYTVREYLALSRWGKLKFRIIRNPVLFLVFGPIWMLFGMNRIAFDKKKSSKLEQRNVYTTNAFIVCMFVILGMLVGVKEVFLIASPVLYISAAIGIWLFYIQHQFEHTYWQRNEKWDYFTAALKGSSFYKLPRILDWFTASIGYHHIHHLMPQIPNYNLRKCAEHKPELQENVHTMTLFSGFGALFLALWDEDSQRLLSFAEMQEKYLKPKHA